MKKVLVLGLLAVAGYFAYEAQKEKKAEAMVQEARQLMDAGEFDRAKAEEGVSPPDRESRKGKAAEGR